ncbi:MAG TPA: PLDc N-terminal domain-containing protein [Chitinophagaceae bacterium]|nr:PLDc N-terminal domain-containing protein [Chitinophagaceae bacterium]
MKNRHLFILAMIGSLVGSISFFIRPEQHAILKYWLLAFAALILLLFHFLTLRQLVKKENLGQSRRIFWTIVIICVPLIGNIIYLIINDAINSPQILKHAWLF